MQPPGPGVFYQPKAPPPEGTGPWAPPGFSQPWPADEYLFDGGDRNQHARVLPNWEVRGLDTEDTIAHYDTLDGRRVVEPSNRVQIYSPRFCAVRQVVSLRLNEQMNASSNVRQEQMMRGVAETQEVRNSTQNLQTSENTSRKLLNAFESEQGGGTLAGREELRGFEQDMFLPYENLTAIRTGRYEVAEMARLAASTDAAITWTHDLGVLVIIDRERATAAVRDQSVGTVFGLDERPGSPRLRIIKVASTANALPGEIVEFTSSFRQRRKPGDRQRDDHRQSHHASGTGAGKRRMQLEGQLPHRTERRRFAGPAVGNHRPDAAQRRRCDPVQVPGAVIGTQDSRPATRRSEQGCPGCPGAKGTG